MNLKKGSKGKADKENVKDQGAGARMGQKHLVDDAVIQEESPIKRIKPDSSVIVDPDFDTLESVSRNFTKSDAKGGRVDKASPQVAVEKNQLFSQQSQSIYDCINGLNQSNSDFKSEERKMSKPTLSQRKANGGGMPRLNIPDIGSEEKRQINEALDQQSPINTGRWLQPALSDLKIRKLDEFISSPSEGDKHTPGGKPSYLTIIK